MIKTNNKSPNNLLIYPQKNIFENGRVSFLDPHLNTKYSLSRKIIAPVVIYAIADILQPPCKQGEMLRRLAIAAFFVIVY